MLVDVLQLSRFCSVAPKNPHSFQWNPSFSLPDIECLAFQRCFSFVSCEALLFSFNKRVFLLNVNVFFAHKCVYFGNNYWDAMLLFTGFIVFSLLFFCDSVILITKASQNGIAASTCLIQIACIHTHTHIICPR